MLSYSFYETDTRVRQYASALIERGDCVDVIALKGESDSPFEILNGVNVYRVQTRTVNEKNPFRYLCRILRFLVVSAAVLTKKHLSRPYAIVHVHSVPDFLVLAALVPRLFGARVILDIHDILPEFYASKFNLSAKSIVFRLLTVVERLSAALANQVVVANELWHARLVSRSVKVEKCTTIRNYPDPHIFVRRPETQHKEKFLIMYPGTLNQHQGVDVAMRAFAKVAAEIPQAEFQIYGEGPAKPFLIKLRDSLGLAERVHIQGFIPVNQIAPLMARANLAVVPKRVSSTFGNEAASTKIMEFMSLGVPVIVSRTKIDAFYHDDSMVKFVEPENETELANAILMLWRNPALREHLAANGLEYVEQNNWAQGKQRYLSLIDSLAHTGTVARTSANAEG